MEINEENDKLKGGEALLVHCHGITKQYKGHKNSNIDVGSLETLTKCKNVRSNNFVHKKKLLYMQSNIPER